MGSLQWGGNGVQTLCETFMEEMTGCGWQGTSALDAWQRNASRQHAGLAGAQVGDSLYFDGAPENGGFGHVGIMTAPDEFCSVTDFGVKVYSISVWVAPLLGWVRFWA